MLVQQDSTLIVGTIVSNVIQEFPTTPGGRLTVDYLNNNPVGGGTSNVLTYCPYLHDRFLIRKWDATSSDPRVLAPINITPTVNTTATTANQIYDVFLRYELIDGFYRPRLSLVLWTNFESRYFEVDPGVGAWLRYRNSSQKELFVGTVRTNSSNQFVDTSSSRLVWNFYNRIRRPIAIPNVLPASWTKTTTTWGAIAGLTTARAEIVNGSPWGIGSGDNLSDSLLSARYYARASMTGTSLLANIGIGINDSSNPTGATAIFGTATGSDDFVCAELNYRVPNAGYYYVQPLERVVNSGTTATFYNTSHLQGEIWC